MEGTSREGTTPSTGNDQTSFGSELGTNDAVAFGDNLTPGIRSTEIQSEISTPRKGRGSGLPALIADGLQAGADALRQRRASASTGSTGSSVTSLVNDPAIAAVSDSLATGMQSGAEWLRDADIEKLKEGVEKQVKEHPARSLFVALGAGFLLGKVLRR